MSKLPFVIWVLGAPLLSLLEEYVNFLTNTHYPDDVTGPSAIIEMCIWAGVGGALWFHKERKP